MQVPRRLQEGYTANHGLPLLSGRHITSVLPDSRSWIELFLCLEKVGECFTLPAEACIVLTFVLSSRIAAFLHDASEKNLYLIFSEWIRHPHLFTFSPIPFRGPRDAMLLISIYRWRVGPRVLIISGFFSPFMSTIYTRLHRVGVTSSLQLYLDQ